MLVKLDVFRKRDLLNFEVLLNVFESAGVSDVRYMRQQISEHLTKENQTNRKKIKIRDYSEGMGAIRQLRRCQCCQSVLTRAVTAGEVGPQRRPPVDLTTDTIEQENESVIVFVCKKCGWSEVFDG